MIECLAALSSVILPRGIGKGSLANVLRYLSKDLGKAMKVSPLASKSEYVRCVRALPLYFSRAGWDRLIE